MGLSSTEIGQLVSSKLEFKSDIKQHVIVFVIRCKR